MNHSKGPAESYAPAVWEDLINDFLEMACFLSAEERACLLAELAKANIRANEIQALPAFSIEKRLISVCENVSPEEFWIYYPKQKKIEKIRG